MMKTHLVAAAQSKTLSIWGVGGKVNFAGFTLGAHYNDFGETGITTANANNGADAGSSVERWSWLSGWPVGR